ncbi:hypothetical protein [Pseudonocardia charpentierae]|uniref:Uncharacterized protein n=1 Tax=Pseudonocardia charpentierae TaxID=3075545 RepID=A0ABU2NJE4_9PSEU|nr:hypothetical protein [Pseudonocardia sp. DSM 45834]MDT0353830.1 hypothetical protein [Pseudonocardia sp. DSM 45834]
MAPVSTGTNSITIEDINSVPSLPAPSGTLAGMYCVVPVGMCWTPSLVVSSRIAPSGQ